VSGAAVLERALAPADEAELAAMVADAFARRSALEIVGGGTRRGLGRPVAAETTLTASRLVAVPLYEPASLTLVAGAGAKIADIEAMLAAEGQRLPFEPMDHRAIYGSAGEPTIGGVVAGNLSGPRRVQVGACRDALLGVRFVDGRGTVVKNGGRVMKNVTGYDLVKLMAGSWGTLGVLTEAAFKLLPIPEAAATVIIEGLDDATALAALRAALGSPFDVSGAAHLPGAPALTLVRRKAARPARAARSGERGDRPGRGDRALGGRARRDGARRPARRAVAAVGEADRSRGPRGAADRGGRGSGRGLRLGRRPRLAADARTGRRRRCRRAARGARGGRPRDAGARAGGGASGRPALPP
jgi:FAD/FMN-containing dehydrogenase